MSSNTFDWSTLPNVEEAALAGALVDARVEDAEDQASQTELDGAPAPPAAPQPALIAGRYELGDLIGRGGGGQVYAGTDRLAQEEVAIKLMAALRGEQLARLRREITALRWLRLPGVVRMRDSGLVGHDYFIVMDRVDGRPFPGAAKPLGWETLEPLAMDLLEILARVHHAGVIHRDLKPANVLVTRAGRPVVLDFGLAVGRAVSTAEIGGRAEGTPAYVAPEQILGRTCDARADLYAVGTMLFEALAGVPPHGHAPISDVINRRLHQPPPRILSWAPDLPRHVAAVIDRLLSREPAERFASAAEVIDALGGHTSTLFLGAAVHLPQERPATIEELRPMFRGPDPFLHLAEDGARVLWERTGGQARLVGEELGGWVRAGLAFWEGDLLVIERPSLERLERGLAVAPASAVATESLSLTASALLRWVRLAWPDATKGLLAEVSGLDAEAIETALAELRARALVWPLDGGRIGAHPGISGSGEADASAALALARASPQNSEARLHHLLSSGADAEDLIPEVVALGEDLLARGRAAHAITLLELGLDLLSQVEGGPPLQAEDTLLRLYCIAALRQESETAMERALYELGRGTARSALQADLATLIQGCLAARRREGERASTLLESLPEIADGELEIWRQASRVLAVVPKGHDAESRLLGTLGSWAAGNPQREAKLAGWRGNLLYRQSRFLEAARHHLGGMALKNHPDARVASQLNAAVAYLDALCFTEAETHANEGLAFATAWRHARYEALFTCILRMVEYRTGRAGPPREDLIAAATHLGPYLEGLFAVVDAAAAWRSGQHVAALALATRARNAFGMAQFPDNALLSQALGFAASGGAQQAELEALVQRAERCRAPGIGVQTLGLLALACGFAPPTWRETALRLALCRPRVEWGVRLEVLSFDEALTALSEPGRMPGLNKVD